MHKFQTDTSIRIFLLTTQVGGEGLTLTGADRVILVRLIQVLICLNDQHEETVWQLCRDCLKLMAGVQSRHFGEHVLSTSIVSNSAVTITLSYWWERKRQHLTRRKRGPTSGHCYSGDCSHISNFGDISSY